MSRYRIEKAEEGTPEVDAFLAAGFEPFAVVSEPITQENTYVGSDGVTYPSHTWVEIGHVNVIWFRRNNHE